MYLSATMTIDPSTLTQLRRKPTKGFRRFAELLTANLLSKQEEHETFTALSIIQELNVVLRSIGVTDLVKFSRDSQVLYDDSASTNADDFPEAINALTRNRTFENDSFSILSILLEHHLTTLAVVIEIRVSRVHEVGIYPIQLTINAIDSEMQSIEGSQGLPARLDEVFASQQTYDSYVESKKTEFEGFVRELEQAFRTRMNIVNLNSRVHTNIIRPGLTPAKLTTGNSTTDAGIDSAADSGAPMIQRYHGGGNMDSLMYLWMWSNFMHSNNTHCHDATIVDEKGIPAFSVGSEGFNAGESATMDPDSQFEVPDCPIEPVEGVGGEVTESTDFGIFGADSGTDAGSSWFDSFGFGGDGSGSDAGSSGGDAGGASCGGGSACSGGCGGGCGS